MKNAEDFDPEADFEEFRLLSNSILSELAKEYGLREVDAQLFLPGMWIVFHNSTTEVAIQFEYTSGMWVTIGRLATFQGRVIGGEQYNLETVLSVRAPNRKRRNLMRDFDARQFADALEDYAIALKLHADDILRGDFACFGRSEFR